MIGKTISHYRILEKLGEGGMGVVYKAEDTKLKRTVALKFLPPELTRNPEAKGRFLREAQAASSLDHANICTIHEINETEDEQLFIVMACYEGQTLKEKLNNIPLSPPSKGETGVSPLPMEETIGIVIQISEGLVKAHEQGIIHRDIKPANILITDDGIVKILDFGIAKLAGQVQLTKDSSTLGTVAYMSPEQLGGKEVDHRTDIWSLGVVLYELLTGKVPFTGEYEQAVSYAILNEEPGFEPKKFDSVPDSLVKLLKKLLSKDLTKRTISITEFQTEMTRIQDHEIRGKIYEKRGINRYLKPKFLIPSAFILFFVTNILIQKIIHLNRVSWAEDAALPKIEELINTGGAEANYIEAFNLATKAEKYIPDNPQLKQSLEYVTGIISIKTKPSGAKIFRKPFNRFESEWKFIGISPIDSIRMPNYLFRWKFVKSGYDILYRQFWSRGSMDFTTGKHPAIIQECILEKQGNLPENMVRIPGKNRFPDFFIDKYEVTNKQFKQFIDNGGYQDKSFWKVPFIKNNKTISWKEAILVFRDATGRQGPALWEGGTYPETEDSIPVHGVSWYEAVAYVEFAGKSLPTVDHWKAATGRSLGMFAHLFYPMCNFGGKGPVPVGTTETITEFGVYDMAGNVREWCWNASDLGRCIRGGAWSDIHYMYSSISQADPFDRSEKNGIRCVIYPEKEKIPESYFASRTTSQARNFYEETPVSDPVFDVYKNLFSYDKMALNTKVEATNEQSSHWIHQKISFSAAYNNERIIIHLYLPKNSNPPYQTVIYFPGSGSVFVPSSDNIKDYYELNWNLSHLIKNGRAVVYPVYKGTFERRDDIPGSLHFMYDDSHEYKDYVVKVVKDFRRVIDYLETRPDIDAEKLAFYGFSWGAIMGSLIPAVEERIKISIINAGGLEMYKNKIKPEVDHIHYVSRVAIPTIMLHGKYDRNVSFDKAAKPMFDLLGTPDTDKKLVIYETDHIIPRKGLIKESLDWLDHYFGPVEK